MTLLQRLARSGLAAARTARRSEQRPQPERPQLPPLPQRQPVRMPDPVSEYAKRPPAPAPQGLDIHGRQACLCISLWMTISSKSRRSCAARPTEVRGLTTRDPGGDAGIGHAAARQCAGVL